MGTSWIKRNSHRETWQMESQWRRYAQWKKKFLDPQGKWSDDLVKKWIKNRQENYED